MREVISLHVGQCGINLGLTFWPHFAQEDDINADGTLASRDTENKNFLSYFRQDSRTENQFMPRAVFLDTDNSDHQYMWPGTGFYSNSLETSVRNDTNSIFDESTIEE